MRRVTSWCLVGTLVALSVPFNRASAQPNTEESEASEVEPAAEPHALDVYATDAERAHLRGWLEYAAGAERRQRRSAGVNNVLAGAVLMGAGVGLYVSKSSSLGDADKGLGLALIGGSSLFLAVGIFQLARKSDGETRLKRWSEVDNESLTIRELGRYEGELRAQSEAAARALRLQRWGNFGLFMGGALMLGLTPVSNLEDKGTGYIVGGFTAGFGLLGFAFSFIGSPQAEYWKAYQAGQAAPKSRKWGASPAVSRTFVGAQVGATF